MATRSRSAQLLKALGLRLKQVKDLDNAIKSSVEQFPSHGPEELLVLPQFHQACRKVANDYGYKLADGSKCLAVFSARRRKNGRAGLYDDGSSEDQTLWLEKLFEYVLERSKEISISRSADDVPLTAPTTVPSSHVRKGIPVIPRTSAAVIAEYSRCFEPEDAPWQQEALRPKSSSLVALRQRRTSEQAPHDPDSLEQGKHDCVSKDPVEHALALESLQAAILAESADGFDFDTASYSPVDWDDSYNAMQCWDDGTHGSATSGDTPRS